MAGVPFVLAVALLVAAVALNGVQSRSREQDEAVKEAIRNMASVSAPPTLPPVAKGRGKNGAVSLDVGYELVSINDVDMERGYIEMTGMLKLNWDDPRLRYNIRGIDTIRVDPKLIWTPDISLYNSVKSASQILNSPLAVVRANGNVILVDQTSTRSTCDVMGQISQPEGFNCTMKYGSWTFDGQALSLTLNQPDPLASFKATGAWNITSGNGVIHTQRYSCCPEPYQSAHFSFLIQKRGNM